MVTVQGSIADAELTEQSQAAALADRDALQSLQTQLTALKAAQAAAETHLASATATQQGNFSALQAEQSAQLASLRQDIAAVSAASALHAQRFPEQLSQTRHDMQQRHAQQLSPLQTQVAQLPQQLLDLHQLMTSEQSHLWDSLSKQMREEQAQQQVQQDLNAANQLSELGALKLEVQQLQQWRQQQQQQQADHSKTGAEVSAQHAADLLTLKREVQQQQLQKQGGNADARVRQADDQTTALTEKLQEMQTQLRSQSEAQTAHAVKLEHDAQQLRETLTAEFAQRVDTALATQATNSAASAAEMQQSINSAVTDSMPVLLAAQVGAAVEHELSQQMPGKLSQAFAEQQEHQQVRGHD